MKCFDWVANEQKFIKFKQTTTLLWGSLMASQGIFVFLLFNNSMPNGPVPAQEAIENPIALPILFVALSTLVMSFVVPKILLKGAAQKISRGTLPATSANMPPEFSVVFVSRILRYALTESIGMFGFVLGFTLFSPELGLSLIAVSLFLQIYARPSAEELKADVEFLYQTH